MERILGKKKARSRRKTGLKARVQRKVVIVGAGYLSLEVAEAMRDRGIETTL